MISVLLLLTGALLGLAIAGSLPEQVALNYGVSSSEMVVSWAAATDETLGECQYGTSPDNLSMKVSTAGSKYSLYRYTSPMIFKATMTGLVEGNKEYFYRVGSEASGYSQVFSFKSNPGVGKGPITFHVMGDLGQTSNSQETLQEIIDDEAALAAGMLSGGIVSMGDLSYANGNQPEWDSFGRLREVAASKIPMMTTLGNHEWMDDMQFSFTAYRARFDNPPVGDQKELYYSFNAGPVHWVMVAGYCEKMRLTSTQPCLAPGSPEQLWLQKDLASVDRSVTPWIFVVFHQPYVNSNTAHSIQSEGEPMRRAVEDTIYKSGVVDLVLSGHVHAYERSCRVYNYSCVDDAPYYVTIGDGGNAEGLASTWVEPQPAWSLFRQASYGHGELTVYNSTHALWKWHQNHDLEPVIADEFWMIKGDARLGMSYKGNRGITKRAVFANSPRGIDAAKFDAEVSVKNAWRYQ